MRRSGVFRTTALAALIFVLAGCLWSEAPADVKAFERVGSELESSSVLHDPAGVRSDIHVMITGKQSDFSPEQWQRIRAYETMQSEIQRWSANATTTIVIRAAAISSSVTQYGGPFEEKLTSITNAALKGYTCARVREFAFPNSNPPENAADAGWNGLEQQFITAAQNELRKSFYKTDIVAWINWYNGVTQAGQQIAQSLTANPPGYASLFARPGVRRAAVAYAKYCFSPPQ